MLITHERKKLINSILYFSEHVDKCGKVKLFKLLYFLDFEHFKLTGRSVTGLEYHAWKMGPVPVELFNEIPEPKEDLSNIVDLVITEVPGRANKMLKMTPKEEFSREYFSKREIRLLQELTKKYKTTKADEMIEATHLENSPWDQIYKNKETDNDVIPYELALRADEFEEMTRRANERKDLVRALS